MIKIFGGRTAMKCPYCGANMEQGIIQSPHELSWKKKSSFIGRAEFHEGSIVLSELSMLKGSKTVAHLCRNCEKVIIDYFCHSCNICLSHAKIDMSHASTSEFHCFQHINPPHRVAPFN